jgi:indolepyruvate ferredoxin oxidoreductase
VVDASRLDALLPTPKTTTEPQTIDEIIHDRGQRLVAYQDASYANEYRHFMAQISDKPYAIAVAKNRYKLMAYKDEY